MADALIEDESSLSDLPLISWNEEDTTPISSGTSGTGLGTLSDGLISRSGLSTSDSTAEVAVALVPLGGGKPSSPGGLN